MKKVEKQKGLKIIMGVSGLGILFSSYTLLREIITPYCLGGDCVYSLSLPSCAYGLMMYAVILITSIIYFRKKK